MWPACSIPGSRSWLLIFISFIFQFNAFFSPTCSGRLAGNVQQRRQVPRTHNNPTSQAMDTAELPVLGHPAAFAAHQLCLWSGRQRLPPPHHWLYHLPHHRLVNCAAMVDPQSVCSRFVSSCLLGDHHKWTALVSTSTWSLMGTDCVHKQLLIRLTAKQSLFVASSSCPSNVVCSSSSWVHSHLSLELSTCDWITWDTFSIEETKAS